MDYLTFSLTTKEDWLFLWLAVIIITVIIEIVTVGLTAIWVTGGSLAALLTCFLGGHWLLQLAVFSMVTFILICFTRPWAMRYLESRKTTTNYEDIIGKTVRITERIDNIKGMGKADYNGMEWTARSRQDDVTYETGETVYVTEIRGVKLIVDKKQI